MRRSRHRSSLTSDVSSPVNFSAVETSFPGSVNYNAPSTSSPTFPPSSAFFNINNGMTISAPSDQSDGTRADSDISLSNPPMSPHAGALLPSDLLGDEESPDLPGPVTHPRFSGVEQSNAQLENLHHGSPSPVSSGGSRSASIFTSPHESLKNPQETDSQSTHMGNAGLSQGEVSNGVQSASRRLSGLFGFHRQRGKTLADGPPLLGTLKPGQSQSFPRNLDDMGPIGSRRRRLSYTGSWANAMSLFPRSSTTNVTADSSSDHLPSRRVAFSNIFSSRFGTSGASSLTKSSADTSDSSGGYNQFSPTHDPIDPSSILGTVRRDSLSSRPSSTFSFDNQLPHPSTDNRHFGWPSTEQTGHRGSPLGFDWASPATWSRAQSRRPSTQYGSSSHLPLGLSGDLDFLNASFEKQHRPLQAPIGTRPSSSHRPATPKLNPAAPSFKTLFGKKSEKEKEKEKEGEKEKEKDKGKDKEPDTSQPRDTTSNVDDGSPAESRRSKDSRSVSTSAAESYESLERTPSGAPSENTNSKESFIQKITRKGSSSKFNLSWKDRSSLFSKKGDSSQGDIDEDAASETQLGKSVDSVASSTFSIDKSSKSSLGFFTRKSKKSDKTTSESSEKAIETGDEETPEEVQTS